MIDGIFAIIHSYSSLDNAALNIMTEGGDLIAATMLGDRLLMSIDESDGSLIESDVEKGIQTHKLAASMGSSYSAVRLGNHYIGRKTDGDPNVDYENLHDALAWMLVGSERGDPSGDFSFNMHTEGRDLDKTFLAAVCDRQAELYSELQSLREKQGLGEFDNSPMPGIESIPPGTLFSSRRPCE